MKKDYIIPVCEIVNMQAAAFLAASDPDNVKGSVGNEGLTGGYVGAQEFFEDDEDEEDW